MECRNIINKAGRPKGVVKDPNRLKIKNPNGHKIDVDGVQYNKFIRQGYEVSNDRTELILPRNVVPKVFKVGRPKGIKNKVQKSHIIVNKYEKVINPDTKRLIKTNGMTFKNINKKYQYSTEKNEFYKYVNHPKKSDIKLDVTGDKVKKFEKRGYIFDKEKNKIIIPGRITKSAKKNTLFDYDLKIINDYDPVIQMKLLSKREEVIIKRALIKHKGVTFNTSMEIEFIQTDNDEDKQTFTFTPKLMTINSKYEIPKVRHVMNNHINGMIDRYTNKGSGWVVNRIVRHFISVNKYIPLAARSYIKLPDVIQNKKATINIQNKDNKCFMWCLARALDPNPEKNNWERVSKHLKKVCHELGLEEKLSKFKLPIAVKDIPKIEIILDIDINLFSFDDVYGDIYPLLRTKKSPCKTVNLLFTSNEESNHYVLIKDFNKLCNKVTKETIKKYYCMNCIQHFPSIERLNEHNPNCIKINEVQAVKLPQKGSFIKFKNLKNTLDVPFIIYADFESILVPLEKDNNNTKLHNTSTTKTHEHIPCSFGYKVVCKLDDTLSVPYITYKGEGCIDKFFEALFEEADKIYELKNKFRNIKDMIITKEQQKKYKIVKYCYTCKNSFTIDNYKVRDHCHITGLYRGAACNNCNLQLKISNRLPVVIHNLIGYDFHLLFHKLGKFKDKEIKVIPNNMEKYMSFSVGTYREYYDKESETMKKKTS